MTYCLSNSDTSGPGSEFNIPSEVPSCTWLPESLEGDLLGVVIFGFSIWGTIAIKDGGGMGDGGNYEGGGVYGICCCG